MPARVGAAQGRAHARGGVAARTAGRADARQGRQRARGGRRAAAREEVPLAVTAIGRENAKDFERFGQVLWPEEDGTPYDVPRFDADLDLSRGKPRFYLMRLNPKGLTVDRITFHANVTQCLASADDVTWHLVVAEPSPLSKPPRTDDLHAFAFPAGCIVKMHKATWHAGPLFEGRDVAFYNLELSDTNVVDHNTHVYADEGIAYRLVP